MTTISDPRSTVPGATQVNYDEPAVKPPPILVVGPLAWIRNNLFRSTTDTVITLVFGALAIAVIVGLLAWVIQAADWFAVTKNLRLFMMGRFPLDETWRVEWMAVYLLFIVGFGVATWSQINRGALVGVGVMLALLFGLPPLIVATTEPVDTYLAAGNVEIEAGTVTETPQEYLAFIGQAGERVTLDMTPEALEDERLAGASGFADRAAAALINATAARLRTQAEIAAIEARLETDLLTENQREDLTEDLARLELGEPVTETLQVNRARVHLQILDGQTLDVIAESADGSLSAVLPRDGWYVLRKTVPDENGLVLLKATAIEPVLVSELSSRDVRYRSMTKEFEVREQRPTLDGQQIPIINVIDYNYFGERTLGEYLRLHLAPFLVQASTPLLLLTLAAAAGFAVSRSFDLSQIRVPSLAIAIYRVLMLIPLAFYVLVYAGLALTYGLIVYRFRLGEFIGEAWDSIRGRWRVTRLEPHQLASFAALLLWIAAPFVVAALLAPVNPSRYGGLLLTFILTAVGIVASFPIGVLLALGRRSKLPVVKWTSILFIELVRGVPLITVLFIANLMLPLLHPDLVTVPGVIRAMVGITLFSAAYLAENVRGGLQSIPPGQEEAARALGLNGIQVTTYIMLPQALRAVIPALVGQAIALFKDTSLVAIIGLFDLTRIADTVVAQPEFLGTRPETYLFIAIIYFIFSYLMADVSRKIEESGAGAARRF